jgi:hypothetical protein
MFTKTQSEAIVKHLRDIANIFESSSKGSSNIIVEPSKRGRKPGAVADDIRCKGEGSSGQQCKNRATKGTYCGKHLVEA